MVEAIKLDKVRAQYHKNGFVVLRNYFDDSALQDVKTVLQKHHRAWIAENKAFYQETAVNSAYLTCPGLLTDDERNILFKLIASNKLVDLAINLIGEDASFMGSQLFFNPANKKQKNYWHRDPQYHLSEEEQKAALNRPQQVLHFRIPTDNEPGIELVPGSHKHWDTNEELSVRLEKNGHKNFEDLSSGEVIALNKGDLLIFSAMMIHRGLYGANRLTYDILYCNQDPELLAFVKPESLPDPGLLGQMERDSVFTNLQPFIEMK